MLRFKFVRKSTMRVLSRKSCLSHWRTTASDVRRAALSRAMTAVLRAAQRGNLVGAAQKSIATVGDGSVVMLVDSKCDDDKNIVEDLEHVLRQQGAARVNRVDCSAESGASALDAARESHLIVDACFNANASFCSQYRSKVSVLRRARCFEN